LGPIRYVTWSLFCNVAPPAPVKSEERTVGSGSSSGSENEQNVPPQTSPTSKDIGWLDFCSARGRRTFCPAGGFKL
jgi:hypothetical protein